MLLVTILHPGVGKSTGEVTLKPEDVNSNLDSAENDDDLIQQFPVRIDLLMSTLKKYYVEGTSTLSHRKFCLFGLLYLDIFLINLGSHADSYVTKQTKQYMQQKLGGKKHRQSTGSPWWSVATSETSVRARRSKMSE